MKILKLDKKHNFFNVMPETIDDLWTLNLILEKDDLIKSKTTRKYKMETGKSEKITVIVKIALEKKNLDMTNKVLRLSGKVKEAKPEQYVDLNSYHSLDVLIGSIISVTKSKMIKLDFDLLDKAKENVFLPKIYLIVLDDDVATIAKVYDRKFKIISNIKARSSGKRMKSEGNIKEYFSNILKVFENEKYDAVIVAGPGFEKEHFQKYVQEKNIKNFNFTHVNSVGITGLNELLNGGNVKNYLDKFRLQKDLELINKLFKEIAKDGLAVYGIDFIKNSLQTNALKELIISDKYFMNNYDLVRELLYSLDKKGLKYHIISSDFDSGIKLDAIGGIAGFLFYK